MFTCDMDVEYSKTNHVISVRMKGRKSLFDIFKILKSGEYKPKKFSALTFKVTNPKSTLIFFSTGNLTVMGSSSYYGTLYVLQYIKEKLGLEFVNIKLTNIVAKLSIQHIFKKQLNVQRFFLKNSDKSISNMIIFPCCSYNIPNTKIKINIFKTGSLVVTGCSSDKILEGAILHILTELSNFIDQDDKNYI